MGREAMGRWRLGGATGRGEIRRRATGRGRWGGAMGRERCKR